MRSTSSAHIMTRYLPVLGGWWWFRNDSGSYGSIIYESKTIYNSTTLLSSLLVSGEEQGLLGVESMQLTPTNEGWNIHWCFKCNMIRLCRKPLVMGIISSCFKMMSQSGSTTYTVDISTEYADYIGLTLYDGGFHMGQWSLLFLGCRVRRIILFWIYRNTVLSYFWWHDCSISTQPMQWKIYGLFLRRLRISQKFSIRNLPPEKPVLTGSDKGTIQSSIQFIRCRHWTWKARMSIILWLGRWWVEEWVGPYESGTTAEIIHNG